MRHHRHSNSYKITCKDSVTISSPTPVLNTSDFRFAFGGSDGVQIHANYFEFVALPSMRFHIEEEISDFIFRVSTPAYPKGPLYIDRRLTTNLFFAPPSFPKRSEIATRMERLLGTKYVWGGNWSAGIPEMMEFYPPRGQIDESTRILWTLKGVDCSGLLYEATNGMTPRNTSDLVRFGQEVFVAGKTADQILELLQPMDIVVWPGHVWYVLDSKHSIESRARLGGVVERPLLKRLEETFQERSTDFAIRRITD